MLRCCRVGKLIHCNAYRPEDFIGAYDIPDSNCEYCGSTKGSFATWGDAFYEQNNMAQYGGFPPALSCDDPNAADLQPTQDQCPVTDNSTDSSGSVLENPEGCELGCSLGECHSHNVFGQCYHQLTWGITPQAGKANVTSLVIFKGDWIIFQSSPQDPFDQSLYELRDESALQQCDFSDATLVANLEKGVVSSAALEFDEAGTFYYSSGVGCTGTGMQGPLPCHCSLGQKFTVVVKDSSEGLRCHDHEWESAVAGFTSAKQQQSRQNTCHCHSYEQIECPNGSSDDPLYREHIDEIELHCARLLDGTDEVCPYKCFQPMEVLHLHYLECPDREPDAMYIKVNATKLCHLAVEAPEGSDCPMVELGLQSEAGQENEASSTSSASHHFFVASLGAAGGLSVLLGSLYL